MYNWFFTDMHKEVLLSRMREEPGLIYAWKRDLTKKFLEDLTFRTKGTIDNFVTLFITGQQGSFKSSMGQALSEEFDDNMAALRIVFSYDEFIERFHSSKPGDFFILDETVMQFGQGSGRLISNLQTIIETQRARKTSIIVISPHIKYFPLGLFTYVLETVCNEMRATCNHREGLHDPRSIKGYDEVTGLEFSETCNCYLDGSFEVKEFYIKAFVREGERYVGHIVIPIEWKNELWTRYLNKKAAFNDTVKEQQYGKTNFEGMAEKIMEDPEIDLYKTKKQMKILVYKHFPNLTIGESDHVLEHCIIKKKRQLLA